MDATEDRSTLIAATANRLRLVLADFADETPQVRAEHLSDVIERALEKVVPDQRGAFLAELGERFPAWDAPAPAAAPAPPPPAERDEDPDSLAARLLQAAAALPPAGKRAILLRLAGEWAPGERPEWSDQAVRTLAERLKVDDPAQIDADRLMDLVVLLVEFAVSLDQLIWKTWRQVSPKSEIRQAAQLRDVLKRFLAGDPEAPRGQVRQDLERSRQLIAALTSSVSQVGQQFANQYLARFSPAEIINLVKMEPGGFLVGQEAKCWRKYVDLSRTLSIASIENDVISVIARYAESLMKGIGR